MLHPAHGLLDTRRLDAVGPDLLRQPCEESVERGVRDGAAQLRVDLRVDVARIEEALDEPGLRAVCEALELGDGKRRSRRELLEHERMRQPRLAHECVACAVKPAFPFVRKGKRLGRPGVPHGELGERP